MNTSDTTFTDGGAYERLMGRWSRLVGRQFLDWLSIPPGHAWLDTGCGNGAFTEEIIALAKPASVVGIDPAEGQIAYAKGRPAAKPARFEIGDAQSLPFPSASFDVAVSALVIAFIPDPAKGVSELARVVRPGGSVASYMWDLPGGGLPLQPIFSAMRRMGLSPAMPPSHASSTSEALLALWQGAGLEGIEQTEISIDTAFESFDDFWESCSLPVGPQAKAMQAMSPTERETLKENLRKDLPAGQDGRIVYRSFANAIKGSKARAA